jgi:cell division protein FtsB
MRNHKFDLAVFVTCCALLGYLGWHGLEGPRSFAHRDSLLARLGAERIALAAITEERRLLDRKVALMRPESVDPDMLDELARKYLNYVRPNELILKRKEIQADKPNSS